MNFLNIGYVFRHEIPVEAFHICLERNLVLCFEEDINTWVVTNYNQEYTHINNHGHIEIKF